MNTCSINDAFNVYNMEGTSDAGGLGALPMAVLLSMAFCFFGMTRKDAFAAAVRTPVGWTFMGR